MIELLLEAERALTAGGIDRAEELYRQIANADPRNAMAVVGLARVAEARDDDLGAYLLARRALTIDPENDAAGRLARRLEEGLASSAEPDSVPAPVVATAEPAERAPAPGATPPAPAATSTPSPPSPRRSLLSRFRRR